MQLLLQFDARPRLLADVHQRLRRHFGTPTVGPWLEPLDQLVLSLIGGRTRSGVALAAFTALRRRFADWATVRDAPLAEVEATIARVTFAEVKAPQLQAALHALSQPDGRVALDDLTQLSVPAALNRMERLPGVGRKVAAAVLNFSTLRRAALVIDSHHLRILRHLRIVGRRVPAHVAYDRVMPLLPPAWGAVEMERHHLLMKHLGQTICTVTQPDCGRCPLRPLCPDGRMRRRWSRPPRLALVAKAT
ncbi:MAG: Fe-S cluster assembly protein HesB [Pseudomonadota bacterium]